MTEESRNGSEPSENDLERMGEERMGEERMGEERMGEERMGEERLGEERLGEERMGEERMEDADAPDDGATEADAFAEADIDWDMAPESNATYEPDETRCEFLREIAADVRRDSSESKQLSAILYRVSDLYDADEDTSPEEIYLNVRHIMRIKEQGGIKR